MTTEQQAEAQETILIPPMQAFLPGDVVQLLLKALGKLPAEESHHTINVIASGWATHQKAHVDAHNKAKAEADAKAKATPGKETAVAVAAASKPAAKRKR